MFSRGRHKDKTAVRNGLEGAVIERHVNVIGSKDDKLMLTPHNDLIQVGGKRPRLTGKEPRARLNEIKRLLQLLR